MDKNKKVLSLKCDIPKDIVIGDLMTYNITVTNEDKISFEEVMLYEILELPLSFCEGSVEIDGEKKEEDSPFSGIQLGKVSPGKSRKVKFQAIVLSGQTEEVTAQMKAQFIYEEDNKKQMGETSSNLCKSRIYKVALAMDKKAILQDKVRDDEVLYQIKLTNSGQLKVNSIIFQDDISDDFDLLERTMAIDNQIVNALQLKQGIFLGNLNIGESREISYKVRINGNRAYENVKGTSIAKYRYELPDGRLGDLRKQTLTARITNKIQKLMMTQVNLATTVEIEGIRIRKDMISEVIAEVDIKNYEIAETPEGRNKEGQKMTGNKMMIQGVLTFYIDYIVNNETGRLKRKVYQRLFTTNIVFAKDYKVSKNPEILGEIKHIYYDVGDAGELVINSVVFVHLRM